jgi:hypothetical protein
MVDGTPPIGANQGVTQLPARRVAQSTPEAAPAASTDSSLPELPPAEVLDALDTAARVLHELDRKQVSIRLEQDGSTNGLRAHVTDTSGGEHEISQTQLLNVLAGDTASLRTKS